ncbi:hypothetical protein BHE74_00034357 [Ensete ventricosum]|nr:hypothetical protein GW17_00047653 [Ensete ventricosum]RWW58753.1 hypothetical protein BHE74_00034357 [Ensete ventricosum]
MSGSIASSGCPEYCMWASSAVVRRQLFLIRSLGGYCCQIHSHRMRGIQGANVAASEADAESIIRRVTPTLDPIRYKGQAGEHFHACKIGSNLCHCDGLFLVTNNLDLVCGNPLAVLTPNVNEYKRLVEKALDSFTFCIILVLQSFHHGHAGIYCLQKKPLERGLTV